ncbi:MAG: tetratricopeptide repeat protein, partial [Pseudomonadota bacterium]
HRWRAGQEVPEAPEPELLARTYIGALDVAMEAHFAKKDWKLALGRIEAVLEVEQALQRPAEDIAATRLNRANMLKELERFGEAQDELQACLHLFQDDPGNTAHVLSSLASLFAAQGDFPQAVNQERRALAIREQLPDPEGRAILHHNLAIYLEKSGDTQASVEASQHQLAGLVYHVKAGLGQHLRGSLGSYAIDFRRAWEAGREPAIPRVAELLAAPGFRPREEWLRQRRVDLDELQAAVDQMIEQARQWARQAAQGRKDA